MTTTDTTATTTTWLITADCREIGSYPGATRDDAILAYCRDAGYDSIEEAAAVQSMSADAWRRTLDVTEEG